MNRISPRSPEYRQTRNNLIIALQEARARFAKAKEFSQQLGHATLADHCQLYIEDLTEQIGNLNRHNHDALNVAYAEL